LPFTVSFFTIPGIAFSITLHKKSLITREVCMAFTGRDRIIGGCIFVSLFLSLSGCGTTPTGDQENGRKWYEMNNCGSCHGDNGSGGKAPQIADLRMGFGSFVKKLRKQDAPIMPYYPESKISEQDAADIYVFLKNAK
jgi:cytochrome c553